MCNQELLHSASEYIYMCAVITFSSFYLFPLVIAVLRLLSRMDLDELSLSSVPGGFPVGV